MFLKPYQYACVQPSVETLLSGIANKTYLKGGFSSSEVFCVVHSGLAFVRVVACWILVSVALIETLLEEVS